MHEFGQANVFLGIWAGNGLEIQRWRLVGLFFQKHDCSILLNYCLFIQIIRINVDDQVIYVKGNTPGEVGEMILLKDSFVLEWKKRVKVLLYFLKKILCQHFCLESTISYSLSKRIRSTVAIRNIFAEIISI